MNALALALVPVTGLVGLSTYANFRWRAEVKRWQRSSTAWRNKAIQEQSDRHELVVQNLRLQHRDAGIRSGERIKVRATTERLREELGL
jgi:hypothetical protein